jgi:hypothetical protein
MRKTTDVVQLPFATPHTIIFFMILSLIIKRFYLAGCSRQLSVHHIQDSLLHDVPFILYPDLDKLKHFLLNITAPRLNTKNVAASLSVRKS